VSSCASGGRVPGAMPSSRLRTPGMARSCSRAPGVPRPGWPRPGLPAANQFRPFWTGRPRPWLWWSGVHWPVMRWRRSGRGSRLTSFARRSGRSRHPAWWPHPTSGHSRIGLPRRLARRPSCSTAYRIAGPCRTLRWRRWALCSTPLEQRDHRRRYRFGWPTRRQGGRVPASSRPASR
jgi:hypothetical protein